MSANHERPARRNPSLLPREHGIYAEVAFPILTALWIGPASIAGACFALAVIAAFLLHEPVLVLLGRRGAWVKEGLRQQARNLLIILVVIIVVCSAIGLWRSTNMVRIMYLALVPIALPLAFMTLKKQEKTLTGEILIACLISLASVPIAMAGGQYAGVSIAAALAWTIIFVISTTTVHAILARTKRRTNVPAIIVAASCLAVALAAVIGAVFGGLTWCFALVPGCLVGFGVLAARLPVQRLRTLGWLLVLGNVATAALLIFTLA